MKKMKSPSHQVLMKRYFKDAQLKKRIQQGVERLKVIDQIIALREELGFTQAELAARVGVSQPYIARLENDDATNLSLETLIKIVNALNGEIAIHIRSRKKAA